MVQYWIYGGLDDDFGMVWWLKCARAQEREIKQARKSKNGSAEVLLKISRQLPFRTVLTNSGTDYKHHCERAEITLAVLMSYWREKVFTCMRQGTAVRLPGKNHVGSFFPSLIWLCAGWHWGQVNNIQQYLQAWGGTGATKNREGGESRSSGTQNTAHGTSPGNTIQSLPLRKGSRRLKPCRVSAKPHLSSSAVSFTSWLDSTDRSSSTTYFRFVHIRESALERQFPYPQSSTPLAGRTLSEQIGLA